MSRLDNTNSSFSERGGGLIEAGAGCIYSTDHHPGCSECRSSTSAIDTVRGVGVEGGVTRGLVPGRLLGGGESDRGQEDGHRLRLESCPCPCLLCHPVEYPVLILDLEVSVSPSAVHPVFRSGGGHM